ncbi:MAG: SDR family oxidoreductase [Candidatus Melainabacteria bacterium]|nr:SDR family oxidoreductase [Candidatus Melainabacteria bacterium]
MNGVDVVIITGAGRGIGRAVALELGKLGKAILSISQSPNSQATSSEIKRLGGTAESLVINLEDYKYTEKTLLKWSEKNIYKKYGVVLAAGILGPNGPFSSCSLEEWDKCHKVNILGNLAVLKGLMPKMIQNKFGRIVTLAGGGSAYANPTFPAYSATKTAMVRITENIHEDLKDKGNFSIVCLAPGAVETDMLKKFRASGGEVRTVVDISEPVTFIREFIESSDVTLSGSFIHVRDSWKNYLNTGKQIEDKAKWKLRRIE